MFSCSLIRL
ncbi:hypothetical protein LINGRAHAP2_LOCUS25707 [Linum grandiflorum]